MQLLPVWLVKLCLPLTLGLQAEVAFKVWINVRRCAMKLLDDVPPVFDGMLSFFRQAFRDLEEKYRRLRDSCPAAGQVLG